MRATHYALRRYEDERFTSPGDPVQYKMLEAQGETMVIADLDLQRRCVPTPASGLKMQFVQSYRWMDGAWQAAATPID